MKRLFDLINKNVALGKLFNFKRQAKKELPLITISREFGSSGSIVAKNVAQKLGKRWKLYHEQIVDQVAKESHLAKSTVMEVDERILPLIEEIIDDFFGREYMSTNAYRKHLINILQKIGKNGYAIIVGRGAEFVFPNALNVRILGEMNYRLRMIMKYKNVSKEAAERMIETADRKRFEFTKFLYGHDPRKPHHFDLTIRISDKISPQVAATIIFRTAKRRFKF